MSSRYNDDTTTRADIRGSKVAEYSSHSNPLRIITVPPNIHASCTHQKDQKDWDPTITDLNHNPTNHVRLRKCEMCGTSRQQINLRTEWAQASRRVGAIGAKEE